VKVVKLIALLAVVLVSVSHAGVQQPATDPVVCLARNIYFEAQGEGYEGRVAVAQVTINRAITIDRVCDTVYFKKVNGAGHKVAAFSWTLGAAWRARGPINARVMDQCQAIARAVLAGDIRGHLANNVTYYHTLGCNPGWHHHFVCRIGNHLFYSG